MEKRKVRYSLDGMADRMPEVEYSPQPAFRFILFHDALFHGAVGLCDMPEDGFVEFEYPAHVLPDVIEKSFVPDQPVLYDFGEPGPEFAQRQRTQRIDVDVYETRLVVPQLCS